jgi:hypothetical protein
MPAMRTSARGIRRLACAVLLTLLAACAAEIATSDKPEADIPDRSGTIVPGQTNRADLHASLGKPHISSAAFSFDVFRSGTTQGNVIVAITPIPVPFAYISDDLHRYTLVTYDTQGRANAVASGIARRPAEWRNASPVRNDFRAVHLRAGDILFFVDPEGARQENLLAAPPARDAWLRQRAGQPGRCTIVIGCGPRGCPDQIAVDNAPPRRLPLRTALAFWFQPGEPDAWRQGLETPRGLGIQHDPKPQQALGTLPGPSWQEALVALDLPAGEHNLAFSARHLDGAATIRQSCTSGEIAWLTVDAAANTGFWRQSLEDWRTDRTAAMPASLARRPLVLMDDAAWYVPPDPAPL